MQDLKAKLEQLLAEAEDCELVGRLATDIRRARTVFKTGRQSEGHGRRIEAMIATARPVTK